jgi:hypothetical protein
MAHAELKMIKLLVCLLLFLSVAQGQVNDCRNDWPNLGRYDKDNKTVAPPTKNEQRVVFMGDSKWIREYARVNHHTYLDYFSATVDARGFFKEELSYDGLHPNKEGYAVMAPLAEAAITASLKRSK